MQWVPRGLKIVCNRMKIGDGLKPSDMSMIYLRQPPRSSHRLIQLTLEADSRATLNATVKVAEGYGGIPYKIQFIRGAFSKDTPLIKRVMMQYDVAINTVVSTCSVNS